ncbi:hypothetical protein MUN76_01530 [Leucobacter rhizosphaerae]|uniref:TetR family transcriptional regulator n=1 Tax=Leucobacter rhizosphaerae TaxID=2932245 RepID=A0ABY4FWL2_9MICO|nr:hypothetical protein [Leucobacter rhizosphaerae]UOQ60695.1 hypothetical protein MUN76_01530 [Leucobacter rhizosphaerae]
MGDVSIGVMVPEENWNRDGSPRADSASTDARARILDSATRYVDTVGLTLGANPALIAQLSSDAGVTLKQFSKIWATPEDFLTDLFCELANQAQIDRADTETLLTTWQYLGMRIDDLRSPEGRRRVLSSVIRTAAEYNFNVVTASGKWRTYAALSTTIMAWPEGEARTRVIDALRASELAFVETMESFYRNVLPTLGYQLRSEFHNDYQPFVVATASVIEGLGIVRATVPALVEAHFDFPSAEDSETWSVAALAFIGVLDAFFEPIPNFVPDEAIARLSGGIDVTPQS